MALCLAATSTCRRFGGGIGTPCDWFRDGDGTGQGCTIGGHASRQPLVIFRTPWDHGELDDG